MVQNINKITTNTGSVILWNNDSIITSIPKGMYYCHMIDGIVKIKQIGVENIFNIVKTSTIDGETFPLVEDILEKLSSFSRGGGTGAGGAKAYESLAEAMSETPLPSNGTIFYVLEGSSDSGIYTYDSENLNGYYKVFNLPEQGSEVDLSDYAKREELDNYSLITHKHTYDELLDKPILFSGSYNDLTNKPTLFSGDYNDLSNKPTIPTFIESVENQNTTQPNIMFWTGTQAEYDSIIVPNPDTLYFIKP